jgi:signal transduction histidine kinase
LISFARLAFALAGLAAVYLDRSDDAANSAPAHGLMIGFTVYSALLAALAAARPIYAATVTAIAATPALGSRWTAVLQVVDIVFFAAIVSQTDAPHSPYFVFFIFALVTATLRWNWRGAIAATVGLLALQFVIAAVGGRSEFELDRLILRAAQLLVIGGLLSYIGARFDRSSARLLAVAQWPADVAAGPDDPALEPSLAHAAGVLGAAGALAVWREPGRIGFRTAFWSGARCVYGEVDAEALVAAPLANEAFSMRDPEGAAVEVASGRCMIPTPVVSPELTARFDLAQSVSAPIGGAAAEGRLFLLGLKHFTVSAIPLSRIIALRIGVDLQNRQVRTAAAAAAAARERERLAGELHDGVLQNLTAAVLQVEGLNLSGSKAAQTAKALLIDQQKRIRTFIQEAGPKRPAADAPDAALQLAGFAEELARQWSCEVKLTAGAAVSALPAKTLFQISLIMAEAVANAVRHGQAGVVTIDIDGADGALGIRIRDNGKGMPEAVAAANAGPRFLKLRVAELGGQVTVQNNSNGLELFIVAPVA